MSVWHGTSLPMYLSDNKRCLRTICPGHSYDEARSIANMPTLFERRTKLCQSYFRKMHNADHVSMINVRINHTFNCLLIRVLCEYVAVAEAYSASCQLEYR